MGDAYTSFTSINISYAFNTSSSSSIMKTSTPKQSNDGLDDLNADSAGIDDAIRNIELHRKEMEHSLLVLARFSKIKDALSEENASLKAGLQRETKLKEQAQNEAADARKAMEKAGWELKVEKEVALRTCKKEAVLQKRLESAKQKHKAAIEKQKKHYAEEVNKLKAAHEAEMASKLLGL